MKHKTKIPKWLIEFAPPDNWDKLDKEFFDPPCQPKRPIWVCRTRNPYCLARITIGGGSLFDGGTCFFHVEFWPPLLLTPTNKLEKMCDEIGHAVCDFYDISPSQITMPEHRGLAPEPPDVLHLWSDSEYLLQPQLEHLWRLRERDDGGEELTKLTDWGKPITGNPLEQTRRLQQWLRTGQ